MAPEQALGYTELDGRADLYALGLCLWAALSGKIPFDESGTTSSLQVLSRHINEDLPDVRTRAPEVSADAAAIVAGLAARERDHRYPSAAAALEDVVRVLDGGRAEGVAAPPAADPTGPDPAPAPEPEVVLSGDAATLSKTASTPAWGPPQPTPARVSPVQVVAAAVLGIALTALGLSQLGPSAPPPQPAGPPPPRVRGPTRRRPRRRRPHRPSPHRRPSRPRPDPRSLTKGRRPSRRARVSGPRSRRPRPPRTWPSRRRTS